MPHDLFLDGSTLGGDTRVSREPLVAETTCGLGVSAHRLSLEYRLRRWTIPCFAARRAAIFSG